MLWNAVINKIIFKKLSSRSRWWSGWETYARCNGVRCTVVYCVLYNLLHWRLARIFVFSLIVFSWISSFILIYFISFFTQRSIHVGSTFSQSLKLIAIKPSNLQRFCHSVAKSGCSWSQRLWISVKSSDFSYTNSRMDHLEVCCTLVFCTVVLA